jgi:hypothetical protein
MLLRKRHIKLKQKKLKKYLKPKHKGFVTLKKLSRYVSRLNRSIRIFKRTKRPLKKVNKIVIKTKKKKLFYKALPIRLRLRKTKKKGYKSRIYIKKRFKTRITRLRKKLRRKIKNAYHVRKYRIARRNLNKKSYFYRFVLRRYKRVYKRTVGLYLRRPITYQFEAKLFDKLLKNLRKKRWFARSFRYKRLTKFNHGVVYLSHYRRNTFVTIFKLIKESKRIVFKSTGALNGFPGTKRVTKLGRESVAKAAATFLRRKNFTSVDVIFTKRIGRLFFLMIRGLFSFPIYLRHIYMPKRRSHGFTRRKKIRRT